MLLTRIDIHKENEKKGKTFIEMKGK